MKATFLGHTVETYTCPHCRAKWWQSSPAPRGYWRACWYCEAGGAAARKRATRKARAADRVMAKIAAGALVAALALLLATQGGCSSDGVEARPQYGASGTPANGCWTGATCANDHDLECCATVDCIGCQNTRCRKPGGQWRLLWRDCTEVDSSEIGICRPR